MNKDYITLKLLKEIQGPTSLDDIFGMFSDRPDITHDSICAALDSLENSGRLIKTRNGRYGIPEQMNLLIGRVNKVKKGFGFLVTDIMDVDDLYISADDLNSAQNGDKVIVRVLKPGRITEDGRKVRAECQVIRVLERHNKFYVGTFVNKRFYCVVIPDNPTFGHEILVPAISAATNKEGDKVLVHITNWGSAQESPEGEIYRNIGQGTDPGVDVLSLVYRFDLDPDFTQEQLDAAQEIADTAIVRSNTRRDFRMYRLVTIDGADSKDLDDAVSLEILDNGHYLLGVHIADVSEYIKEGSLLDKEAYRRGTSVYFVDRVLPMLPTAISNGICSLNAGQDRFAMSVIMEMGAKGQIISVEICESIINVAYRFTYDTVNDILANQSFSDPSYVEYFNDMEKLANILHKRRIERGALEFDIPESKVELAPDGTVTDIHWTQRGIAEGIIEEFMIAANETVAAHFFRRQVPFIYRVHEAPDKENLDAFLDYLPQLGISVPHHHDEITGRDLQDILAQAKEKDCEKIVNTRMLRMMSHAYYSTGKQSHFGLASRYYTHFTSPIRRYSDLSIHRIIKEYLRMNGQLGDRRLEHWQTAFNDAATQASSCERNAEEAERASVALKKAEFMEQYVGNTYKGQIVSVTSFGFFVQLENSVEGLVHISTLFDDYYAYDEENIRLIGERTHNEYKLGQMVDIIVSNVNVKEMKIDFTLKVDEKDKKGNKKQAAKALANKGSRKLPSSEKKHHSGTSHHSRKKHNSGKKQK